MTEIVATATQTRCPRGYRSPRSLKNRVGSGRAQAALPWQPVQARSGSVLPTKNPEELPFLCESINFRHEIFPWDRVSSAFLDTKMRFAAAYSKTAHAQGNYLTN